MPKQPVPRPMSGPYTFVVYAPFASDENLSRYRNDDGTLAGHPLFNALTAVAQQGTNVCAYIDLVDGPTWYVQGAALAPGLLVMPAGKQDMERPQCLADLLQRARSAFPGTPLVLSLEGHGAGWLPHLDRSKITLEAAMDGGPLGPLRWRVTPDGGSAAGRADGNPIVGKGSPLLPAGSPFVATNHRPLSTMGLRMALQLGLGNVRLAVLHLNNCFNLSFELLASIQPFAQFATSYANYNYFTAGMRYPDVLRPLPAQPSPVQLARRFAEQNRAVLPAADHPTTGAAIMLSRLPATQQAFTGLARALVAALDAVATQPAPRRVLVEAIRSALAGARHYDTWNDTRLDRHDELIDLPSLSRVLHGFTADGGAVALAAKALTATFLPLIVHRYGVKGWPWQIPHEGVAPPDPAQPEVLWNFEGEKFSLNLLCPDPDLEGLWDWRSAFYLQTAACAAQPVLCPFITTTGWRDFIEKYHTPPGVEVREFVFRPARIPAYPVCNRPLTQSNPGQP